MRILFPCGLFYPSKLGGPANTLYWLAKALVKDGFDVSVVASNNHIEDGLVIKDQWTQIDGIRVRYCSVRGAFPFGIVRYASKEMKACDIVVFSSICYLPNFPLAIKARLRRKKIVWSPRGELLGEALQGNKGKLLYFKLLKLLLGKYVLFHATSNEEKAFILSIFGSNANVVIIPNYMELPQREKRDNLQPGYFLYLGRIAPIKALDKLVKGIAKSNCFMQSNYVFKLAGGVEEQFEGYYTRLQELIHQFNLNNKVVFIGAVNGKEKYSILANARYLFLVSNSENFGNVVLESLSQGTPVVASQGTPWHSLVDNNAGFWIKNSPEDIANCIDQIFFYSEKEYLSQCENALALAKRFDVFENISQWRQVFEALYSVNSL